MPEATNFEKYLAGAPLNEELAAIRRGEEPQPNPLAAIFENLAPRQLPMSDDDRPLSKEERLSLREAAQAGAVTTLLRLMRKSLRAKIQTATMDSENDPLGRAAEVSQQWAYIVAFRRATVEIQGMIQGAIAEQEKEERGQ